MDICTTHYGHTLSLGHVRLSCSTRLDIARKLSQGVTVERILDDVRNSVISRFNRSHLLTKKDISNIERSFHLRLVERHSDDATSTALWVEEMRSSEDANPVLLYKPQGKTHQQLEVSDF